MPVNITEIPGLQGTRINAARADARTAGAPAAALSGVAEGIASISNAFLSIADDIQAKDNARQRSEIRSTLDQRKAQFLIGLENEIDPQRRLDHANAFVNEQRQLLTGPHIAPVVQQDLLNYYDQWRTQTRNQVAADAARLTNQRATLALDNELLAAHESGDYPRLQATFQEKTANGLALPEEWPAIERDFQKRQEDQATIRAYTEDAAAWLDKNAAPPESGDPVGWQNHQRAAKSILRQQTADTVDLVQDMMADGRLTTPEQLEELAGDLRPAVLEALQNSLEDRATGELKRLQASPEAQAELIGEITTMIDAYDPEGADLDLDLVNIETAIAGVANGPMRDQLEKQVSRIKKGEEYRLESLADLGREEIKLASESGDFGPIKPTEKEVPLEQLIEDGLLQDWRKLSALGMSKEEIEPILEAETTQERVLAFRESYKTRSGFVNPNLDPLDLEAFKAINSGTSGFILAPDPAFDPMPALSAKGRAMAEYEKWLALTPNPTEQQITEKVQALTGREVRNKIKSSALQLPPKPGKAIPTETSMNLPKPLAPLLPAFNKYGKQYGIDPRFLAAISQFETASGTSSAFRNKKNAMGVSPGGGGPRAFATKEASIEYMARSLANPKGPYRNATTLQEIAAIYSPPGAGNDPNGTNHYWPAGVAKYLKQMGVDPATTPLISRG